MLLAHLLLAASAAHADCTLQSYDYEENFNTSPFGDKAMFDFGASNTPGWNTSYSLNRPAKQGAFQASSSNPSSRSINERILAAAEGKVAGNADRLPLVYITDTNGCAIKYRRYQVFPVSYVGSSNASYGGDKISRVYTNNPNLLDPAYLIDGKASCAPGVVIATSPVDIQSFNTGNKNSDILADIVAITPSYVDFEGTVSAAYLYLNDQDANANAGRQFKKVDIAPILKKAGVSMHGGSPVVMSDIDGDGRSDLLVASSSGTTNKLIVFYADPIETYPYTFSAYETLIDDLGFTGPFADASNPATGFGFCANTSSMTSRGVTGLAIKDLNGDGLKDIFVSSASEPNVHVFWGTSPITFERGDDITTPAGSGIARVFAQDFSGDGVGDVLVALAGSDCGIQAPYGLLFRGDGNRTFTTVGPNLVFQYGSIDWATTAKQYLNPSIYFDSPYLYNYSLIWGQSTAEGIAYSYGNFPSLSYLSLRARAQSRSLTRLLPNVGNLVNLTLHNFGLRKSSSLQGFGEGSLKVSADNGLHWETVADDTVAFGPVQHDFAYMGKDLVWRVDMSGPPVPSSQMGSRDTFYAPASQASTILRGLKFSYTVSPPATMSRSKVGYSPATGQLPEMAYTARFDTPRYTGHLIALPLTSVTVGNANTLTAVPTTTRWDAGQRVAATSAASRNLFVSIRPSSSAKTVSNGDMQTYGLSRATLTATNLDTALASGQTLRQALQIPATATGVASAQLNAIRAGSDPSGQPTLRDPGHSSPVYVGSPNQDANYMGNNYAQFVRDQANRAPFVLLGNNDGMVHAFDAASGAELWGMAPANLLPMLRTQAGRDADGKKAYVHQPMVDGPISTADVYSASTGWRTVAIVGQAQGVGLDQRSYYHAIDVTSPSDPLPLWEMTQGPTGGVTSCDPDPCHAILCTTTPAQISYDASDSLGSLAAMYLNAGTKDGANRPYAYRPAWAFSEEQQGITPPRDWRTVVTNSGSVMESSEPTGACAASTYRASQNCSELSYKVHVDSAVAGDYRIALKFTTKLSVPNNVAIAVDTQWRSSGPLVPLVPQPGSDQWTLGPTAKLTAGDHTIRVYAVSNGVRLTGVALISPQSAAPPASPQAVSITATRLSTLKSSCKTGCLPNPDTRPWPGCQHKKKCCGAAAAKGDVGNGQLPAEAVGFCQDVSTPCGVAPNSMGQSFSPPAFGPVRTSAGTVWAAFFGSGPVVQIPAVNQGRSIYMVNALTGAPMASWQLPAVSGTNAPPLGPTVVGGPVLVDADGDGFVDRVYVGDMSGRLWKIVTQATATLSGGLLASASAYPACVVFDASAASAGAPRTWAPIVTTPTVALLRSAAGAPTPNIYFGTGGDAQAPNDGLYSLYGVRDSDALSACTNTPRYASNLTAANDEWQLTAPTGARFWTGATTVANSALYVTASTGVPDSINPCAAANQNSYVYGIALTRFTDSSGKSHAAGSTLLNNKSPYFTSRGIIRAAPTVRGVVPSSVVRPTKVMSSKPTDVLLQQSGGGVLRLSTPGLSAPSTTLRLQMVREITY